MNIPMSWLKQYVKLPDNCDINMFIDKMTMSGSKVEGYETLYKDITNVVTGKILSIRKHENADSLVVTQVEIGNGETVQIVTGATNLYEGAYIPVALVGATLADGLKISKGKLRGVESNGMLCSIEEMGLDHNDFPDAPEDGIYIFENEVPLGIDAKETMDLHDDVVEFEITSNRSDCFSVLGIAREAAATFKIPFNPPKITLKEEGEGNAENIISVEIKNPKLCPRYIGRIVTDVVLRPSPRWMRKRLRAAGVRPINNIVDITNYVMLEYGQPMHAFDIDTITNNKIIVRNAEKGELFTTLDGVERVLDDSMLVIADEQKAVAIAGVMGGENSKVSDGAKAILFESANFNGPNVRITSKKLGLRTDSSSKFEKGLDPNLAEIAVNRALQLVEELDCGKVVKGMADCYPNKRNEWTVKFNPDNINKLLGLKLSKTEMCDLLELVELKTNRNDCTVTIKTFRPDIELEADLAEEIARLYGYDNIPTTLAAGTPTVGKRSKKETIQDLIRNIMISMGVSEALTYSFESPKIFDKLLIPADSKLRETVTITNPLGEDFSVMRTQTVNGILQSLSTNYNRRNETCALFELSKTYIPKQVPVTKLPTENEYITIGSYGNMDFYTIKGQVEQIFESLGIFNDISFISTSKYSFMHPGRCANIMHNNEIIGYIGEVHPIVAENYEIDTKAYLAVLSMDFLINNSNLVRKYTELPRFPAITRDIALLAKEEIEVAEIEKIINERGGKILESYKLFDIYRSEQIGEGMKSIAYSITFRAPDRTLVDEDVNKQMNKILFDLQQRLNIGLRG